MDTLEWRSEYALAELRVRQIDVSPVVPHTCSDWVEALTTMFAPPYLLSNLCRDVTSVRQGGTENFGESADQHALRISSLFKRLLPELKRTAPSNKSPQSFAWKRSEIAVFEKGLLPSIIIKQVREGPSHIFASARNRDRRHASNNLHGINATNLSSAVSTPIIPVKNHLETRLEDVCDKRINNQLD